VKKYYAVRVGRKTGIFTDVNEYLSYTIDTLARKALALKTKKTLLEHIQKQSSA
jgi:hypothetical protein